MKKTEIKKTVTLETKKPAPYNTKELINDITFAESVVSDVIELNSVLKNLLLDECSSSDKQLLADLILVKIHDDMDLCGFDLRTTIEKVNASFSGKEPWVNVSPT